jgi:formylglycine-generating enzyme required for sulfatase activity
MPFDVSTWKKSTDKLLTNAKEWLTKNILSKTPGSIYTGLCALSLLPLFEAAKQGQISGALFALGSVAGGVGANLIANTIQDWKDKSDQDIQKDLETWVASSLDNHELLSALSSIINELGVVERIQNILDETTRQTFQGTFDEHLGQYGILLQQKTNIFISGNTGETHVYVMYNEDYSEVDASLRQLRQTYLHRVFEQSYQVSLAGIDPKAKSQARSSLLSLPSIYVALLSSSADRLSSSDLDPSVSPQTEGITTWQTPLLADANRYDRLVVLGDPGSGKTTFINFISLCLAGEALGHSDVNLRMLTTPLPSPSDAVSRKLGEAKYQPWSHKALLPIRIALKDLASQEYIKSNPRPTAEQLLMFIEQDLSSCGLSGFAKVLRAEILDQGALLLLDGLDEVPESTNENLRTQIKRTIEDFAQTFGKVRILITSRTYAYQKQDWKLNGFEERLISPFNDSQISQFIRHWYEYIGTMRGMSRNDILGRGALLEQAVFGSERLRGLATRPLLLTLMASLHAWRGGNLPEKREELYADVVDLLLDWWESPKVVVDFQGKPIIQQPSLAEWLKVDRSLVRKLLNKLAYQAHLAQSELRGTANISENELVLGLLQISMNPDIKPKRLVEYLSERAGLILPHGVGLFTFPHRTFQEYLSACHLTDFEFPDSIARHVYEDHNRWREVALLAGAKAARGTASAIWLLAEELCPRDLADSVPTDADLWAALIAGQIVLEGADLRHVAKRDAYKQKRLRAWQTHIIISNFSPFDRAIAGRSLASLGDTRLGVCPGMPKEDSASSRQEFVDWIHIPDDSPFCYGDEQRMQELHLPPFCISCYPITYAQFQHFVESEDGWTCEQWWQGLPIPAYQRAKAGEQYFRCLNHPRDSVSWFDAVAYCRWLSAKLGYAVRLPTEWEWEKAARGTRGLGFPWGNDYASGKANINELYDGIGSSFLQSSSAVGIYPQGASPYGVLDMCGNIWEWCINEYAAPKRIDFSVGERRVLRGGSWNTGIIAEAHATYRGRLRPEHRGNNIGFRIVASNAIQLPSAVS